MNSTAVYHLPIAEYTWTGRHIKWEPQNLGKLKTAHGLCNTYISSGVSLL